MPVTNQQITDNRYRFTVSGTEVQRFGRTTATGTMAPGDRAVFSIYAALLEGSSARMAVELTYIDSGGSALDVPYESPLVPLGREARYYTDADPAPSGTSRVRVACRFQNADASPNVCSLRFAQLEKAEVD